MHFPADRLDRRHVQQREFGIQETDVERRVVDDEFGAAYEIEEFSCDVGKSRLVLQELKADSVNRQRAGVDVAFRVDVAMEMPVGQTSVAHFDATDFDNAMAELVLEACRFSVEEYLAHDVSQLACSKRMY